MKMIVFIRRSFQIFFLILFIYLFLPNIHPPYSIPQNLFFIIDPLIAIFISITSQRFFWWTLFAFVMILATLFLGRFYCGWICPLGTLIDICGALRKSHFGHRIDNLRFIKYYVLAGIIIFLLFGIQILWALDPTVIAARFFSFNLALAKNSYRYLYAWVSAAFFLFIIVTSLIKRRLWCSVICPLGALYAVLARFSFVERVVKRCTKCMVCIDNCRMSAIKNNLTYHKEECILCMDCLYDCKMGKTEFILRPYRRYYHENKDGLSRREFLFLMLGSFLSIGLLRSKGSIVTKDLIRPPGALEEEEFLDRCIRCGNCMTNCITNGLQPVMFESRIVDIWTPKLVPEIGYCAYDCNLCGRVCPTGAIQNLSLEEKRSFRLGVANIERSLCLNWAKDIDCKICYENCPLPEKAIKLVRDISYNGKTIFRPYVDKTICIGCGTCQNKCPQRPIRAIRVSPKNITRF